ncbi:trifunctional purine biosynthetic protein adenosine-3-like [Nilaparvata lugens]|uniref:trifunctional purine biosynthetic protein adenosine-3-like n=1 Tax=Nilaparvata lugens TaxID=108931 RepID=UPI00193DA147|nr:trifunctional purine biosynthetic protein adenosine-3-like [Nilaparvata lugens]
MPAVFPWLCATGRISEPQMLRTFNCGIGMVVICSPENKQQILDLIPGSTVIGTVHKRDRKDEPQVKVLNYGQVMEPLMLPYIKPVITKLMSKKRLAVLISGNGSNLQALIDATKGSTVAEIVLVISNKDNVMGLERAKRANIPSKVRS